MYSLIILTDLGGSITDCMHHLNLEPYLFPFYPLYEKVVQQ